MALDHGNQMARDNTRGRTVLRGGHSGIWEHQAGLFYQEAGDTYRWAAGR